jgi:hypothetical protein
MVERRAVRRTRHTTGQYDRRDPEEREAEMTMPSAQNEVQLKYSAVNVLATPEVGGQAIHELRQGDPVCVTRQVGLFYAVSLADGREGFVFTRNLSGVNLPPGPGAPATRAPEPPAHSIRGRLTGWLQALTGR